MGTVHDGAAWQWVTLTPWDPASVGAVCSVCNSCPPAAFSAALSQGVEVMIDGLSDDTSFEFVYLFTEEIQPVVGESRDPNFFRSSRKFFLTHLWALPPDQVKVILDKISNASQAIPALYQQFGLSYP